MKTIYVGRCPEHGAFVVSDDGPPKKGTLYGCPEVVDYDGELCMKDGQPYVRYVEADGE